jgi:hypothetical protein
VAVLIEGGPFGGAVVGDPAPAPGTVPPEHGRCGERVDGRQPGVIVERQLGERAGPLSGDRPEAQLLADRVPRLARFPGPADVDENLGVDGELERPGGAYRLGRRGAGRCGHDHASNGLAGGELRLFG